MSISPLIASILSFAAGLIVYGWIRRWRKRLGKTSVPETTTTGESARPESSLRDSVTALYNRKHLLQRLQDNIARFDREKKRMAVILWDIDGFVDFNNTFGQAEGDRLLVQVADTIRKALRGYDEAFRVGADEFCAILGPADDKIAADVTRRVREMVSRQLFQGDAEYANRQFSISSGLVFYPGEHKLPEALLHAAGQELYQARLKTRVLTP